MQKTALRLVKNEEDVSPSGSTPSSPNPTGSIGPNDLTVAALERYARDWLCDCQYRQHSPRTTETRRLILDKLLWFLREQDFERCGLSEIRAFLVYLSDSHDSPEGRWNNPKKRKPIKARTIHTWHGHLRAMFVWMVKEEILSSSPMRRIDAPLFRRDQIQPFSDEQINALMLAARRSLHPRRDEAILMLLLDTGLRASEL